MENPDLIAILLPTDEHGWTEDAFQHRHNNTRYLAPARGISEDPTISSREATPAPHPQCHEPDLANEDYHLTRRLQLAFEKPLKDPSKGFAFGTNPQICDVVLGKRGFRSISGLHFCITFNKEGHLLLKDTSTYGMSVSYDGQAKEEVRHCFSWRLDLEKETGEWDVEVHVRDLSFKVRLASHHIRSAEYKENIQSFLSNSRNALPPVDILGIHSHTTTAEPSEPLTPRQRPVYIRERKLGSGAFGSVDKVIDVSTGAVYARKEFYKPQGSEIEGQSQRQREEWLNMVRREVRIMRENLHESTIPVIDSQEEPLTFMVMPYFSLGNLEDVHRETPVAVEETIDLLFQTLTALEHLHGRGVAHRDLKPENFLIESRTPFRIKVADFGLANDKPDLTTFCGTPLYAAPEIYWGRPYTPSVDLWSLGVIILQYAYELPKAIGRLREPHQNAKSIMEARGLAWCRRVSAYANTWESDALIDLLTSGMLRMQPEERLSAGACLTRGYELSLFQSNERCSGSATPTARGARGYQTRDLGSCSTVVLGALWTSGRRESNSRETSSSRRRSRRASSEPLSSILGSSVDISSRHGIQSSPPNKRQGSPIVGTATQFVRPSRSRRKEPGACGSKSYRLQSYEFSGQRLGPDVKSNDYSTLYDVVVAVLADLVPGEGESLDSTERMNTLLNELCYCLDRLEVIGITITRNHLSGQDILTTNLDREDIVLASLTGSEMMASAFDLVAHLLHMARLHSPRLRSTAAASVGDQSPQVGVSTDAEQPQTLDFDSVSGERRISSVRRAAPVTFPSALLDVTNLSTGANYTQAGP